MYRIKIMNDDGRDDNNNNNNKANVISLNNNYN